MTKRLGVLTSGGDAPGMNAALRAVVRAALDRGAEIYAIYEGYRGMIAGGDQIRPMTWNSVGGILQRGGTVIGTARCPDFQTRDGRKQAVRNLLEREIDGLVVIGGDGSLTGANLLRQEWAELVAELVDEGAVSADLAERHRALSIAGLVGSIDNDMYGTDMTIGADTALHRITDAVDAITSTAASHQRAFVVEVMGRRCGYLAVMSAIATGAERVYLHEEGVRLADLQQDIQQLIKGFNHGKRLGLLIRSEGANPLYTTQFLAALFEEESGDLFNVRISVLGHLQQGGDPAPFDRILAVRLAARAVERLEEWHAEQPDEAPIVCMGYQHGELTFTPIDEAMRMTDPVYHRPKKQWWMDLRPVARMLAQPDPSIDGVEDEPAVQPL